MVDKKKFSILYLEDEEQDVRVFAEEIKSVVQEITGEIREEDGKEAIDCLDEWGVTWVNREELFWQKVKQKEYKLLIIDLFFDDIQDVSGMLLIERLEKYPIKGEPLIWILSRLSHYRMVMTNHARVHRFFTKDEGGLRNMRSLLLRIFAVQREAGEEEIEFLNSYSGRFILGVCQIISIDATSAGIHKQYRQRRISCVNPASVFSKTEFVGGRYDLIKDVLQQIEKKGITDLVQVSRTVIINIRHISKIEVREKACYLTMAQCGDNIESQIKVGDSYKASLNRALGMVLY